MDNSKNGDSKANILIVDGDPDDLTFLTGIFSEKGYQVQPESNGKSALVRARANLPALILLDIKSVPETEIL